MFIFIYLFIYIYIRYKFRYILIKLINISINYIYSYYIFINKNKYFRYVYIYIYIDINRLYFKGRIAYQRILYLRIAWRTFSFKNRTVNEKSACFDQEIIYSKKIRYSRPQGRFFHVKSDGIQDFKECIFKIHWKLI